MRSPLWFLTVFLTCTVMLVHGEAKPRRATRTPTATQTPSQTLTPSWTATPERTSTLTLTLTSSLTGTRTATSSRTETSTVTETPTVTPTPRIIEVEWMDTSPLILEREGARISYSLLSWAEESSLTILSASGVFLRSLDPAPAGPGAHDVRWDGRDRLGNQVPNGVYLAVLKVRRADVALEVSHLVEVRRFQPLRGRDGPGIDIEPKGE